MKRFHWLILAGLPVLGCGFLKSLAGRNTLDLEGANIKSMGVDIRKQQKTICPRERVQMAVFADVVLDGESEVKKVETWQGGADANRNDKLDFADFAFASSGGSFDDMGWFTPNRDLVAGAGKEFDLRTVYRRRPDKFTFTTTYKPDYRCITGGGGEGNAGVNGSSGTAGSTGESGGSGSSTSGGTRGGDGGQGGNGAPGSEGGAGPDLVAYATYVKTPFYDKLVAVRIEGGATDLLLFPPEQKLTLSARGGGGGAGGAGGPGGHGGSGGSGNPPGDGGRGGSGGSGANGGNGGAGGHIELVVDARYPEIAELVQLDVSGGAGGEPGSPGPPGQGGSAGSTMGTGGQGASSGGDGTQGTAGQPGARGADGTHAVRQAAVLDKLGGLGAIEVL